MAAVPGSLIWEIVKKNHCFLVKEFGNGTAKVQFSKETNNLYNAHSYKYSGLANNKTVTVQPGGKDSVVLATTKTRKQNKPSSLLHKSVMKKEFSRMARAVENQGQGTETGKGNGNSTKFYGGFGFLEVPKCTQTWTFLGSETTTTRSFRSS